MGEDVMEKGPTATSPGAAAIAHWFKPEEIDRLLDNGRRSAAGEAVDPVPPALLFQPDGKGRWLITELDPMHPDMAYGLCDAGIGLPECGVVSLAELWSGPGPARMRPERDAAYTPSSDLTLSRLDRMASEAGRIVV